jgi:16S rRNA (uracil1498-N3)-methyltransferase
MSQIPRLFSERPLTAGSRLLLEGAPAHYLAQVLRLGPGDAVDLFDDIGGEWRAEVVAAGKRAVELAVGPLTRPREEVPDLWLCVAPLRRQRFEWVIEKAAELGVRCIVPVLTRRTVADRINPERLRAHMIEAAEQCGRTALPQLGPLTDLPRLLAAWAPERRLLFADETGGPPLSAGLATVPAAILIGPEGGFDPAERQMLRDQPFVQAIGLGPRILRADTAAVTALAQFQLLSGT